MQGADELGILANILMKLYEADVNIYASSGVSSGEGSFGYIIYVRPDEFDTATKALDI